MIYTPFKYDINSIPHYERGQTWKCIIQRRKVSNSACKFWTRTISNYVIIVWLKKITQPGR